MTEFTEEKVGRYQIKVGNFPDGYRFAININGGLFKRGVENTREKAFETARNLISNENSERLASRIDGVPTAEEFKEALSQVRVSDSQWDMLKAHYNAQGKKLSSTQLATAAGYDHLSVANMQYGALGHKLADELNYQPPGKYKNGDPLWITVLVHDSGITYEEDSGHFQHELREEVAKALELLGEVGR